MKQTTHLRSALAEDLSRYLNQSADHRAAGNTFRTRLSAWLSPPLQSIVLYRMSHWLWSRGWKRAGCVVSRLNTLLFRTTISPASSIGPGFLLPHPPGASFCGRAGRGLTMYSLATCWPAPHDGCSADKGPRLGDDVTLGGHSVVLGSVNIEDGARIGFKVTLEQNVPSGALVFSRSMRALLTPDGVRQ